jgi:hypothetical protein
MPEFRTFSSTVHFRQAFGYDGLPVRGLAYVGVYSKI